jgi:hypothetical protein
LAARTSIREVAMEARQIFETILVHPLKPEYSLAALFLGTEVPAGTGVELVSRSLGIEPLSGGEISEDELRRVLACILTDSLEVFDMNPRSFRAFVNESGIDDRFLEHVLTAARLVVERGTGQGSALAVRTLGGLLSNSLGAALGLYALSDHDRLHDVSGRHQIELLVLLLRDGVLVCGSRHGLDRALHFGLQDRLYEAFIAPKVR